MMTDPIADMLTRIRNANAHPTQARSRCPPRKLKVGIAEVLKDEGFIDGYERRARQARQHPARHAASYGPDGEQVIRSHRARQQARPPRLHRRRGAAAPCCAASASYVLSTPKGVVSDRTAREDQRRRRGPLQGLLSHVAHRKAARHRCPSGSPSSPLTDVTITVKGPKGELVLALRPEVEVAVEGGQVAWSADGAARIAQSRAYHGMTRALIANMVDGRHQGLREDARDHRRRLERRGARAARSCSTSASATRSRSRCPQGVKVETPNPTTDRGVGAGQAGRRPARRRDPRRRARRSPTRARASATRTSTSVARPARASVAEP